MTRKMEGRPPLEVVGGGMAEWSGGESPHGRPFAPVVFVDASGQPELLELPSLFTQVGFDAWGAKVEIGDEEAEGATLTLRLSQPQATVLVLAVPARYKAFIGTIKRMGILYICPTTPALGISARLAKDHSFSAALATDTSPGSPTES